MLLYMLFVFIYMLYTQWMLAYACFTFLLCMIALCMMYVCMYVYIYIYIYICTCACVGDCALCMTDSHGYASNRC